VIVYIGILSKFIISGNGEREINIINDIIATTIDFDSQEIRVAASGINFYFNIATIASDNQVFSKINFFM
jgi:hypothetical protein